MKRLLTVIGLAAVVGALLTTANGCGQRKGAGNEAEDAAKENAADSTVVSWDNLPDEPVFDIVTTMGTIKVKLYSKTKKHRENFIRLVRAGYYDGVLFHRVINNFMIQAGDPLTKDPNKAADWGTGGPDYTIPAEFVPEYYHKKGALAAARRGDAANPKKASHGSQFYLVQDEYACLQLDGEYTVFGETVSGFDVIDRIAAVQTDRQDRPLKNVKILHITLSENQNPEPEQPESSYDTFSAEGSAEVEQTDSTTTDTSSADKTPEAEQAEAIQDTASAGGSAVKEQAAIEEQSVTEGSAAEKKTAVEEKASEENVSEEKVAEERDAEEQTVAEQPADSTIAQ